MTLILCKKKCRLGLNVCMNYEFNLLHHVGVVAKRVRAAAAAETAVHEGDDNTPSGPTGRGVKIQNKPAETKQTLHAFSRLRRRWIMNRFIDLIFQEVYVVKTLNVLFPRVIMVI